MPFVNIRTVRGLLTPAQRNELATRVTELLVEVEGRGNPEFRNLVWVLVEEHEAASWCLGGRPLDQGMIDRLGVGGVPAG
jgi:4-oxalocrotonate tautomerase